MASRKNIGEIPVINMPGEKMMNKDVSTLIDVELMAVILEKGVKGADVLSDMHSGLLGLQNDLCLPASGEFRPIFHPFFLEPFLNDIFFLFGTR